MFLKNPIFYIVVVAGLGCVDAPVPPSREMTVVADTLYRSDVCLMVRVTYNRRNIDGEVSHKFTSSWIKEGQCSN